MINLLFTRNILSPIHMGGIRHRNLVYRLMKFLAAMLLVLIMAAPVMAGVQTLGTPVDNSADVSGPYPYEQLMVTIPSSASQGGNDATSATVSILGTVALADVSQVAAFYNGVEEGRLTISGLSNQVINLPNNTKGGAPWTFFIRLNASAAGKTFGLTVHSIAGTEPANLNYSTQLRNATGASAPEITVLGNGTEIVNGDTTPSLTDDTDYGSIAVATTLDHTFTVQNDGTADLTVGTVTVDDTTNFSVTVQPQGTVAASNSTTFTVRFQPQSAATFTATVTIPNNDGDEATYTFDITGIGTAAAAPEITVLGNGTEIVNGDTTPSLTDDTDYGSIAVATTLDHTFTVQNDGTANLTVGTVTVDDTTNFSVTVQPQGTVAASNSTTFTVRFQPQTLATFTATVTIPNNDGDEATYTFDITGTGVTSPPTVTSPSASSIGLDLASLGGTVTAINDTSITERGIYWSLTPGFTPPGEGAQVLDSGGPWIGTPMPFAVSVTPLPSGSHIYFKAFAINSLGGTGYTGEASFWTEPAQAASVGFESVLSTSMTVTWTAGGGDGALVVMYNADPTGQPDPSDGTEYTGDAVFSNNTTPLGSGYVVYSGPANSVPVSGLTPDTTYYVRVYEYAGSAALINYQQDSPATGFRLTTAGGTGHNADHNITNCDQCHALHSGTGGIVAHGADQEIVCKACHNETQMGTQNSHLWDIGMHEVTKGGPQTVDCGSCHDVHNGSGVTDVGNNLKRIRRNTTKYISGALEPALYEVQDVDFAFDENNSPWNAVCQTCHTNASMKWHTNANQASEANPHNHNMSGGVPNPVCTVCHTHSGGFAASGGSCNECHNSVKNAGQTGPLKYERRIIFNAAGDAGDFIKTSHHATNGSTTQVVTENDCAVCHEEPGANHMDNVVNLKNPDTGVAFTIKDLQENPGEAQTIQDNLCLKCHDLDGAFSTWNSTEGVSKTEPFSNNTGPVRDVFSQFDKANSAFHPVRDTTNSTGKKSDYITATTMVTPWTNVGNQTMTCFDCHDNNAHGSDYQKMIKVEDPGNAGTYYGITFSWYENFSGDMSKSTPPANDNVRIEWFCTKCHNPNVYVTGTTNQVSAYEYHGQNQQQHSAAGGNQLGCLGCHAGIVDQNGGVVANNGAWNGNIHGVFPDGADWDWETDGGLTFGSKNWPGTPASQGGTDSVPNNFLLGGWLSGWSGAGECGGGNCNHSGSADKGGGQSYDPTNN